MQFSAKQTKQQALKRKPATLNQFLEDISWALREEDVNIPNHETEVIQITQAPYAFGVEDISESEITNVRASSPNHETEVIQITQAPYASGVEDISESEITNVRASSPNHETEVIQITQAPYASGVEDISESEITNVRASSPNHKTEVIQITQAPYAFGVEDISESEITNVRASSPNHETEVIQITQAPYASGVEDISESEITDVGASSYEQDISETHSEYFPESNDSDSSVQSQAKIGQKLLQKELFASDSEKVNDSDESMSVDYPLYPALNIQVPPLPIDVVNSMDNDSSDGEESDRDPEFIALDKSHPKIFVKLVEKSKITKTGRVKKSDRVYNSHHPCPFCGKMQTNFSHHILSKIHNKEQDVKDLPQLQPDEETEEKQQIRKERKRRIELLRLQGCHKHNMKVLEKKKGEIILARRSATDKDFDVTKFGPCPNCVGWIKNSTMTKHQKVCPKKSDDFQPSNKTMLRVQSDALVGRISDQASQVLVKEVFTCMQADDVSLRAQSDPLIISLGNQWMDRNRGNRIMRKYYASQAMRLAAKLLIHLNNITGNKDKDLNFFLQPSYFESVAKAALQCSKQDADDDEDLASPSNAIKLGYDIKSLASSKLGNALINGDNKKKEEAENFLKLMNMQWGLKVTKLARVLLNERHFNRRCPLPKPDDVKKITVHMKKEISSLDLNDMSYQNYRRAAILVLARTTLYNRRRCHEVQALRLDAYQKRKRGIDEIATEMMGEMTAFEKHLLETQEVVEIRGKVGRCVPVILPEDVRAVLTYIASGEVRKACQISADNPYLFANRMAGVFRGYDAIYTLTKEAGLTNPNLVRTSNMRKYMATMVQALDTNEAERSWIVQHLGHSMDVHMNHYRQTSDLIERTEVAKLLLIQDFGVVSKYVGKKLKDIQLDDIIPSAPEAAEDDDHDEIVSQRTEIEEDFIPDLQDLSDEDITAPQPKKRKKMEMRKRWSLKEEEELKTLFKKNFEKDYCPRQQEIENAMKKSCSQDGLIHQRPRDNIKKKVSFMLIKRRKASKKNT
ncbi:uncharacterized protein LOC117320961 isoform X2 [Pecten maximus]|uniref:uncharacterized protein LOC117320961 isoform X2 n=1 Tax=Pecten maximus TaxID=6579 RepID=UPI00145892AB|nr:uncharacterized protein LOC117320961 isoform X2 [Pecten maximus]